MTRICTALDCITEFKHTVTPPSFREFERDSKKSTAQKITVENDNLSEYSEPERDVAYSRGNSLWNNLKSNHKLINLEKVEDLYLRRKAINTIITMEALETVLLEKNMFTILMPGLVECLKVAKTRRILMTHKFKIDAVDFVSEYLYNHDPKNPERLKEIKSIFDIEKFRKLAMAGERGYWPSSWDWDREQAVIVLQKNLRGWLVRKRPEVQRIRMLHNTLKFPWRAQSPSVYPSNIYDLIEIYPEIQLPNSSRFGMSYEDCYLQRKSAWEEAKQMKVSEDKVRQFLRRVTGSSRAEDLSQ